MELTDSDRIFLDMAFVSILSFQFHPANHAAVTDEALDYALSIAVLALQKRNAFIGG